MAELSSDVTESTTEDADVDGESCMRRRPGHHHQATINIDDYHPCVWCSGKFWAKSGYFGGIVPVRLATPVSPFRLLQTKKWRFAYFKKM